MAIVIEIDGTARSVRPDDGRAQFTLEELQGFVGGYIQLVPSRERFRGVLMLANEEGRLKGMKMNAAATVLSGQLVVGPIVLLTPEEFGE